MGCLATAHEVKMFCTAPEVCFGGDHLICGGGLYLSKYSIFLPGFNSNGRKKVCDKHISRAHSELQTKHTKEH